MFRPSSMPALPYPVTTSSPSGQARSNMPSSEVDTKISKIRSLVDWRINDISKVLRQAEDEWAQKLEEERLKRQESFESVQGLA